MRMPSNETGRTAVAEVPVLHPDIMVLPPVPVLIVVLTGVIPIVEIRAELQGLQEVLTTARPGVLLIRGLITIERRDTEVQEVELPAIGAQEAAPQGTGVQAVEHQAPGVLVTAAQAAVREVQDLAGVLEVVQEVQALAGAQVVVHEVPVCEVPEDLQDLQEEDLEVAGEAAEADNNHPIILIQ